MNGWKLYYNIEKNILVEGLIIDNIYIKIDKEMNIFLVYTDKWVEIGEV